MERFIDGVSKYFQMADSTIIDAAGLSLSNGYPFDYDEDHRLWGNNRCSDPGRLYVGP